MFLFFVLLFIPNQLVAAFVDFGQDVCIQDCAGHGDAEEGEEEEEGLEDIQEPSVSEPQDGRADGQEVSRKIIVCLFVCLNTRSSEPQPRPQREFQKAINPHPSPFS